MDTVSDHRLIQSYGRRRGRPLRRGRATLIAELLPRLEIEALAPGATLDPRRLFARPVAAVWLEVGFGGGEHLAAQAERHRDIGFIGAEPYVNGIAGLLARARDAELDNLRLWPNDVRPLLAALAPGSIARAFVLFPDPWPKARHHKRRLVAPPFLDALARIMAPAAELRLATDDAEYAAWMQDAVAAHPAFGAAGLSVVHERPADWAPTRYEAKALAAGRTSAYLAVARRP